MTTDRTAIRRRLQVRRGAYRPPWGARKAGHGGILAPRRSRPARPSWIAFSALAAAGVAMGAGLVVARAERERSARRQAKLKRRFGLLAQETPAQGLQRIALGQLDLAIELLREEASMPQEQAVHETRKAFKRLRALMRLLEDQIGRDAARRERQILRDAGRRLAGARDAEVMVATLEDVLRRGPRKLARRRGAIELLEHLRRERAVAARRMREDAGAREQVVEELLAMRVRVQMWRLPERSAIELAGPGLEHIYRSGRRARGRARADKHADRAMHKWRKHTKELRYALEGLDMQDGKRGDGDSRGSVGDIGGGGSRGNGNGDGDGDGGHKSSSRGNDGGGGHRRIGKLAREADALGELLGEDHDLVVLAERIRAHKPLRRRRRTRKRLLREISQRRAKLRKRAMRRGFGLYKRKAARFVRRVRP